MARKQALPEPYRVDWENYVLDSTNVAGPALPEGVKGVEEAGQNTGWGARIKDAADTVYYGLGAFIEGLGLFPEGVINTAIDTWDGGDIDVNDQAKIAYRRELEKRQADYLESYKGKAPEGLAQAMVSAPYSALTIAPSLLGAWVGGPAGYGIGMGGSGTIAYRATKQEFMNHLYDMVEDTCKENNLKMPTQEQWDNIAQEFETEAWKYGAWEAIPEAVGNMIFVKLLAPVGKIGAGWLKKGAGFAGGLAEEQATETATGWGQGGVDYEMGWRPDNPDIWQAFDEQKAATFWQTLMMGGATAAGTRLYNKYISGKRSGEEAVEAEQERTQDGEESAADEEELFDDEEEENAEGEGLDAAGENGQQTGEPQSGPEGAAETGEQAREEFTPGGETDLLNPIQEGQAQEGQEQGTPAQGEAEQERLNKDPWGNPWAEGISDQEKLDVWQWLDEKNGADANALQEQEGGQPQNQPGDQAQELQEQATPTQRGVEQERLNMDPEDELLAEQRLEEIEAREGQGQAEANIGEEREQAQPLEQTEEPIGQEQAREEIERRPDALNVNPWGRPWRDGIDETGKRLVWQSFEEGKLDPALEESFSAPQEAAGQRREEGAREEAPARDTRLEETRAGEPESRKAEAYDQLDAMTMSQLQDMAKKLGIQNRTRGKTKAVAARIIREEFEKREKEGKGGEDISARPDQERETGLGEASKADVLIEIPGKDQAVEARHELIELDDAQPSHFAEKNFDKNPRYALENERQYHIEEGSRNKVLNNALHFKPEFLLRDSVDANNGAPVIDQDGNVLGGNGRTMSLRLVYQQGGRQADEYKEKLRQRLVELGIDPARMNGMKKPMLVRRLKGKDSIEARQALVSALNDTFTDSKNARAAGKSRGDRLSQETLKMLAEGFQDASSLREFFDLPQSLRVVDALIQDNVIMARERNALVGADGLLNPDGKRAIEEALRGRIARNYESLARLPGDWVTKLDAIAPSVIIAENMGGKWNITDHIKDAIDILGEYRKTQFSKNHDYNGFLNAVSLMNGKSAIENYSPASIQFFLALMNNKKTELARNFKGYASDAVTRSPESNAFEFTRVTPEQSARKHLGVDMEATKVDIFRRITGIKPEERKDGEESKAGERKEEGEKTEAKPAENQPAEAKEERTGERFDEKYRKELPLVADVESGVIHKTESETAIQAAINWVKENVKSPVKTEIGDVIFDKQGVENSFRHLMYQNKLDAIQSVEAVLKSGAYLGNLNDKSGKPIINHYFAGRARIGNTEKIVFVRTRKADGDKNRFYVHEVFTEEEIKKRADLENGSRHTPESHYNGPLDFYKSLIARYLEVKNPASNLNETGVEKKEQTGKESFDEKYRRELPLVADVESGVIHKTENETAIQAAINWVKENVKSPVKTEIGDVIFGAREIKDSLSHGFSKNKLDAIPGIAPTLEKGIYLGEIEDFKVKSIKNFYFASKIKIGEEEKAVFVRVRQKDKGDKRFYVHEVYTEEEIKEAGGMRATDPDQSFHNTANFYKSLIARYLEVKNPVLNLSETGVEKKEQTGKESFDEKYRRELPLVADVESGVIHKTENETAIQAAINWVKNHITHPVKTSNGEVEVTGRGVKNSFSHSMYPAKLDAVQAIEPVLRGGMHIGELPDIGGKRILNRYYAGRVKFVNGAETREDIVFIRTRQAEGRPQSFYVHEVFTGEEILKSGILERGQRDTDQAQFQGARDFYKSLIARYLEVKRPVSDWSEVGIEEKTDGLEKLSRSQLLNRLDEGEKARARRLSKPKIVELIREKEREKAAGKSGAKDGDALESGEKTENAAGAKTPEKGEKANGEMGRHEQGKTGAQHKDGDDNQSSVSVQGAEGSGRAGESDQGKGGSRGENVRRILRTNTGENRSDGLQGEEVQGSDRKGGDAQHDGSGGVEGSAGERMGLSRRGGERRGEGQNRQDTDGRAGRTYLAPEGSLTRKGSWLETAERNLDIIELSKRLAEEKRAATPEEQALLAQYTGFGAAEIRNNLFPVNYLGQLERESAKGKWKELHDRALKLLDEKELKTVLRSTQYAHYTPEKVIRSIWKTLERMGFKGGRILEPGMGTGLFAIAAPQSVMEGSVYTGVEMDSVTARIAAALLPESNVINKDFTRQKFPDNFFDLAIGNPPFADITVKNDPAYKKHGFLLHDYFFAKSLDKVRPGGLLVFVTSSGTMDKKNDAAREFMAKRADLLGAIRLPQSAFKENAGAEVVTDILFLRKRRKGEAAAGESWKGLAEITTPEGKAEINEYFAARPEMVLGKNSLENGPYGKQYTVLPLEGDIGERFEKAAANLPGDVYAEGVEAGESKRVLEHDMNPKAVMEGGLYLDDQGNLRQLDEGVGKEVTGLAKKSEKRDLEWLRDYVGLKDALKRAQYDQLKNGAWEDSLKKLNDMYDAFAAKHGPIKKFTVKENKVTDEDGNERIIEVNKYENDRLLRLDAEKSLISQLEDVTSDGRIVKGPFLKGRTIGVRERGEIRDVNDALMVSLDETGELDIADVAKKAGISREEAIKELGDRIYQEPGGGWLMADEYLSGEVRKKLEEAREAARVDKAFERNVKALEKVQPKWLDYQNITVDLGAGWVPVKYVNQFADEVIGHNYGEEAITYNEGTGTYQVPDASRRRETTNEYGTKDVTSRKLLEDALNNRTVKISKQDADKKSYVDTAATALANEKIKKMKEAFAAWVWTDKERMADLVNIYNQKMNNLAPRKFDGSHLTLPGLSLKYKLYPHQKRAIWRIIQTGNTYLAHAVGAGKTLEMIVAGMEMKRLGLVSRPLYIVPNHMLGQFASEFQQAYPLARIMTADEANFDPKKRDKFIARAALNKPDAIIMTHTSFGNMGVKPETFEALYNKMIDEMKDALEEAKESGSRITRSKIEKRLEKLENELAAKLNAPEKQVISFEDMGVDFLFVDEAHEFRKLDFTTNRTNVKGISPEGSRRALDLFTKIQHLESVNPGRSHVFASGTPITNTMGELYNLMRFMKPQGLKSMGLNSFDAWASCFGNMQPGLEQNASGGYQMVERFSKFVNLPELMSRVNEFMDTLTMRQLGDYVQRPDLKTGAPQNVVVPASKALKKYQKELGRRLERAQKFRPSKDRKGNPDPIVNIITDAKLAAIDMRFINPEEKSDPNSKLNVMIDKIIEKHFEIEDRVYHDSETGKEDAIKGGAQIVFSMDGFGSGVSENRGFDVKAWIEKRLTEEGVPAEQIAWMRDCKNHAAKEALFKDMREGKKRILFGTPKNMGTGVNAQKRLCALHYLSAPWYPADVEQPHGRILRQGNQNGEAEIFWYATKGTYDSTMWGMVSRKARFIEQAFSGDKSLRKMEDISESSQYEMAAALAAGDERIIRLAGLKSEVERLERLYQAHREEQDNFKNRAAAIRRETARKEEEKKRIERAVKEFGDTNISADNFSASIQGKGYKKIGEAGEALLGAINAWRESWMATIDKNRAQKTFGYIGNNKAQITAELVYEPLSGAENKKIADKIYVSIGETRLEAINADERNELYKDDGGFRDLTGQGLMQRLVNKIRKMGAAAEEIQRSADQLKRELANVQKRIGEAFQEKAELADKSQELEELKKELVQEGAIKAEEAKKENDLIEEIEKEAGIALDGGTVWEDGTVTDKDGRNHKPDIRDAFKSLGHDGGRGIRLHEAERVAKRLNGMARNAAPVEAVQRFEELPEDLRRHFEGNRDSLEGFYDPETGKVWLVADNLASATRAAEVWQHEQIGHRGLDGLFTEAEQERLANELWLKLGGMSDENISMIAELYGLDPVGNREDRATVMKETIAGYAEKARLEELTREEKGVWARIVDSIRRALAKIVERITGRKARSREIEELVKRLGRYVFSGVGGIKNGEAVNSYGVPMERVTSIDGEFTQEEAREALKALAGMDLPNYLEGSVAQINSNQRDKITSGKALAKTLNNLFSKGEHYKLASQIAEAWKYAAKTGVFEDRNKNKDVKWGRYIAAARVNGKDAFVLITVKKVNQENKLYSAEILNEEGFRLYPGLPDKPVSENSPVRNPEQILEVLRGPVKEGFEKKSKKPLASLSLRDLLNRRKQGDPADGLNISDVIRKEDMSLMQRFFQLPHWIAKDHPAFHAIYERQLKRVDERALKLAQNLEEVPSLFGKDRLKGADLDSLKSMIWRIDGKISDTEKKSGIEKFKVKAVLPNTAELLELNPDYYTMYEKMLKRLHGTEAARAALLEIRKSLDGDLVNAYNRMAEMRELDDNLIQDFRKRINHLNNYFPHHRYGRYYILARLDGKVVYREHFDQAGGIDRARAKGRRMIVELQKQSQGKSWADKNAVWEIDEVRKLPDSILGAAIDTDAMNQLIKAASGKIRNQKQAAAVYAELAKGVADTLKGRGWSAHAINRKNTPGFETDDIAKILYDYKSGLYGWLTKMEAARDFSQILGGIDAREQPNLWEYSKQYVGDMLANSDRIDRIAGNIKSVAFAWYLGANIKTAAVNLTQNLIVGLPRLQMDVKGSSVLWLKGAADALRNMLDLKNASNLTQEEAKLLNELYGEKVITNAFMEEVRSQVKGINGASIWNKFTEILGLPMSQVEIFNRASLALAAFRAARAGKMKEKAKARYGVSGAADFETAKRFSKDVVKDAHFVYGKTNMPEFMRSTAFGRAISPMYTFRTFSHNLLNMWWHAMKSHGAAGAAFIAKSFAATMALGGVTAIPFYATLMALFQAISGGDDDWTEEIRKSLPEDDLLRDIVCYGLPALAGVQIGGSLRMETPITAGLQKGSNPKEVLSESLGSIIGIPYDLLFNKGTAMIDARKAGNYERMVEEVAPTFVKNTLQAWRLYTEGHTSMKGKPINLPGEKGARKLTAGEAVGKALGFQPTSSTKSYEAYAAERRRDEVRSNKLNELAVKTLKGLEAGDQGVRGKVMREIKAWNKRVKEEGKYAMTINLKEVMTRVSNRRAAKSSSSKQQMRNAYQKEVWGF